MDVCIVFDNNRQNNKKYTITARNTGMGCGGSTAVRLLTRVNNAPYRCGESLTLHLRGKNSKRTHRETRVAPTKR